jgi:DDE superfamily endonuclease
MPTNASNKPIKKLSERIEVLSGHFAQGRPVRYFCVDESRWGLKTLTGRVITAMGVKPVIEVQWPRETFWLYGAVEPSSGDSFFYSFSHLDATCFNLFVQEFAAAFPDTLNLIQLDQAGAHCASQVDWPENVVPLFQPSHSPELNPTERFWQDIRNPFKGKNFTDLAQLQQAIFDELNAFSQHTIASLTGYSFILDALPI